jgi:ribosomal-protein-alanine N-acetyltransferase
MAGDCRIRPALSADLPELARLEAECFPDPWSEDAFGELLASPGGLALAAVDQGDRVIGYLVARRILDESEILNLAVATPWRRHGVGRALLQAALEELGTKDVRQVFLEVRESNLAAQRLYGGLGFRPIGQRPNYYRSPRENGLVLCLTLEGTA